MNQYECASQLEGACRLKAPYERVNHQVIKKAGLSRGPGALLSALVMSTLDIRAGF